MRAAYVDVTPSLIAGLMSLPHLATIVGASFDHSTNTIVLTIDDPQLPEHPVPVRRYPSCTKTEIRWDWNLPDD